MVEPNWDNCTEEDLWKYIATHLAKNNLSTILVGGAVVSIYSEGAYESGDLDFVLESIRADRLPKLMAEIGFTTSKGRHYKHPLCKHLFIEFASPPVGIGEDTHILPSEIQVDGVIIKIYSPTDCIRDRLASVIHFNARECMDQAILVATKQPFDLSKIESWCKSEGGSAVFEEFKMRLKETNKNR